MWGVAGAAKLSLRHFRVHGLLVLVLLLTTILFMTQLQNDVLSDDVTATTEKAGHRSREESQDERIETAAPVRDLQFLGVGDGAVPLATVPAEAVSESESEYWRSLTLRLSPAEETIVARRHQQRSYFSMDQAAVGEGSDAVQSHQHRVACPNRYIFVNTHTYGRHHNQLQEMMNLAVWARRLERTAVLGWFRFDHKWTASWDIYNFSRVMRSYCVVTPHEMMRRVRADAKLASQKHMAACIGQKMEGTPLKRMTAGLFRCRSDPAVPAHYNTRQGMRITREYFLSKVTQAPEPLVVLGGQLAFFMRAGIAEHAAVFGLLDPVASIREVIDGFKAQHFRTSMASYMAIHLRQREKECMKEVFESRQDGGVFLSTMSVNDWNTIETQCQLTVAHIKNVVEAQNLLLDHHPMFLGSDHQNLKLEQALVAAGAVMHGGEQTGGGNSLKTLAVDYFLMAEGGYFTGNQLSSITQNVCYRRLGRGQACHGFVHSFSRYHARNLETGKSWIRAFGAVAEHEPDD